MTIITSACAASLPRCPPVRCAVMRLNAKLASLWLAVSPQEVFSVLPADLDLDTLRTARAARSKEKGQRQLAHAVATASQVLAALEPLISRAEEPLPDILPPIIAQIERVIAAETCPAGQQMTTLYTSGTGDGVRARFTVQQHCVDCPLWATCRPADGKTTSHRMVFLSDYHHYQRAAVAFNATDEGQALLAGRWKIEPVISWLVNYQGCRQARRVGQIIGRRIEIGEIAEDQRLHQCCAVER